MKFRYNKHFIFLSLITLFFIGLAGCKKDNCIYESTLIKLYKAYKNGEISECKHNGQTIYFAVLNAYDAGSNIYDKDGKLIGTCNFAWGQLDSICSQLTECETIYRVKYNIWGQPVIDKYALGK